MEEEERRRRRARALAEERYGFRWHLGWYIAVNAGLIGIWFFTSGPTGFFWPVFPLFFWGIFVVVHYMSAYRSFGRGWVEKETEKILREEEVREP
ncbi:MAG: 2TM domain-containing protein [Thermoplasmata archaeon]